MSASIRQHLAPVAASAAMLFATAASATTLLGNLSDNLSEQGTSINNRYTKAVGMTTGDSAWDFDSMQVLFLNSAAQARNLGGGIYADKDGSVGDLLSAFSNVVSVAAHSGEALYTLASDYTLSANTTYWFRLTSDAPFAAGLAWSHYPANVLPSAAAGVGFNGYQFSNNGGATWTTSSYYNALQINGAALAAPPLVGLAPAVPEPGTLLMLAAGLAGLLAQRRRAD